MQETGAFPFTEYFYFERLDDPRESRPRDEGLVRRVITPNESDRAYVSLPDRLSFLYYLVRPIRLAAENWELGPSLVWDLFSRKK